MVHVEQQRTGSRNLDPPQSGDERERVAWCDAVGEKFPDQPLTHQVWREAQPVRVVPGGAGEVDRPLAEVVLDQLKSGQIAALQHTRLEDGPHLPDLERGRLGHPVRRWERLELGHGEAEHRGIGPWPGAPAVGRDRVRRVEREIRPALDLAQVPVGVHQRLVGEDHILPHALHFLGIPQGEGVVVPGGYEHAVGLDRLQEVHGKVAGKRLSGAGRGEPVAGYGDGCEQGHGEGGVPRGLPCQAGLEEPRDPLHQDGHAQRHPHAPEEERRDEKVVALAHFALQVLPGIHREAVLEIEVEHEDHRDRADEGGHRDRSPAVPPPLPRAAEEADGEKEQGEHVAGPLGPVVAVLPGAVLPVVGELARQARLPIQERWLGVLLAIQHRLERRPGGRLALVDRGKMGGAEREEDPYTDADRRHDREPEEHPPA